MKKIILRFSLAFLTLGLVVPSAVILTKQNEVSAQAATVITTRSSQSYIDSYYSSVNLNQTGNALKTSLATLLKSERRASISDD